MKIDFVKGHCGWDVVTLIDANQVPADRALACAIKIVSPPLDGGLEVGLMSPGDRPDTIRLQMVSSTAKDWIAMCGGMTQVIGKALVETFLRDHFAIDTARQIVSLTLLTPSGEIPVRIEQRDGKAMSVTSTMDAYVDYCYRRGVEPIQLGGFAALRVGDYLILDVRRLERHFPDNDFTRRDAGPHLDIVNSLLHRFGTQFGMNGVTGMLYDDRPEGPGQFRVFPRFYSPDLAAARVPWEFQCGTGTIAVLIALAHQDCLARDTSQQLCLEWGSYRTTRDPYGIRTTQVSVTLENRRLRHAHFSHSVIEILAEGQLQLPNFSEIAP
jgi:hypothetical protein